MHCCSLQASQWPAQGGPAKLPRVSPTPLEQLSLLQPTLVSQLQPTCTPLQQLPSPSRGIPPPAASLPCGSEELAATPQRHAFSHRTSPLHGFLPLGPSILPLTRYACMPVATQHDIHIAHNFQAAHLQNSFQGISGTKIQTFAIAIGPL